MQQLIVQCRLHVPCMLADPCSPLPCPCPQGAVMSLVTGLRSWQLHGAQGERLEELAALVQVRGG